MRRFWIFWFVIFSSVAVMNRVTELSVIPCHERTGISIETCSVLAVSETSRLADIAKNTSYEIPVQTIVGGNERNSTGGQRRNIPIEKWGKAYQTAVLPGFSFVKYKLSEGDQDHLNISSPKDFFIFSLHKIRI